MRRTNIFVYMLLACCTSVPLLAQEATAPLVPGSDDSARAAERKRLEDLAEISRLRKQIADNEKDIAEARKNERRTTYGDPVIGKTGNISGNETFASIAEQRAMVQAGTLARELGTRIGGNIIKIDGENICENSCVDVSCKEKCKEKCIEKQNEKICSSVLVTMDVNIAAKFGKLRSLRKYLADAMDELISLRDKVNGAENAKEMSDNLYGLDSNDVTDSGAPTPAKKLAASTESALGVVNSLVSLAGVFRSDYDVNELKLAVPPIWIIANTMSGIKSDSSNGVLVSIVSDSLPVTDGASTLIIKANALLVGAVDLNNKVSQKINEKSPDKEKKLKAAVEAFYGKVKAINDGLVAIDAATGLSSLEQLAQIDDSGGPTSCVLLVINQSPSGTRLTKETIFGKGGKMYLNVAVQLAGILSDPKGHVVATEICSSEESATINLSDYTKKGRHLQLANAFMDAQQAKDQPANASGSQP